MESKEELGYIDGTLLTLRLEHTELANALLEQARIERIYRALEPFKSRRAGALSGGMKQKLAFCVANFHNPHIIFLDEPTGGVDPITRRKF